jgi:SAM-dependent methyltransferase
MIDTTAHAPAADRVPPMPPVELRRSVGVEDVRFFENPHAVPVFNTDVDLELYRTVLDFGCGCGRIARQLMLQKSHVPERYLGIDLYTPSVQWCRENLTPFAPQFQFRHLNAFNISLNPAGLPQAPLETDGSMFSLVNAHSVFTHILEENLAFYFDQVVSRMQPGGVLRATWFLFDKESFPMMQTFQNCLYINTQDPSNATIYDIGLVKDMYRRAGLTMYKIYRPYVRGHQWLIYARLAAGQDVPFPEDDGPIGLARPPVTLS